MIRPLPRTLLAGFLGLLAPALALAAEDPAGPPSQDPELTPEVDAETARRQAEWAAASLEYLLSKYDADGDGTLVRAEYTGDDKRWKRLDRDKDGQLSLADWDLTPREKPLRDTIKPPQVKGFAPQITVRRIQIEGGPRFHLLRPDEQDNGKPKNVRLDALLDGQPGLLFFANATAPGARKIAPEMARLSKQYAGVRFILVYGPERFAVDGLHGMPPKGDVPLLEEPRDFEARAAQARAFVKEFGLENFNVLVDGLENLASRLYRGEYGRVYLVSRSRIVDVRTKPAHRGVDVKELENAMRVKLNMDLLEEQ